jgi:hypothetical protein
MKNDIHTTLAKSNNVHNAFALGVLEHLPNLPLATPLAIPPPTTIPDALPGYSTHKQLSTMHAVAHHTLTLNNQQLLLQSTINPLPHLANSIINQNHDYILNTVTSLANPKTNEVWAKLIDTRNKWMSPALIHVCLSHTLLSPNTRQSHMDKLLSNSDHKKQK